MARPREFDPDEALERAMQVFWTKGFETASLDDLCSATGLSRSSLYATFGDKHQLLLKSLDRYTDRGTARTRKTLEQLPIREAMSTLLEDVIDSIVDGSGRRGCFVGNCAAELARHDRRAAERVRSGFQRNETAYGEALARARQKGEISSEADLVSLARFLISSVQGLRLMGKARQDRPYLESIARVILRCLELDLVPVGANYGLRSTKKKR